MGLSRRDDVNVEQSHGSLFDQGRPTSQDAGLDGMMQMDVEHPFSRD